MPFNDPFAGQGYPDPGVQPGSYIPYDQQAYPAHQPVYTRPQAPPLHAVPMPAAPIQQGAPATEEAVFEPVSSKRKREDKQENEGEQLDQAPKKKSRNEKGTETKKQKADDNEYRVYSVSSSTLKREIPLVLLVSIATWKVFAFLLRN